MGVSCEVQKEGVVEAIKHYRRLFANARPGASHPHCEEPTGPAFGGPDDKLRDEAIQLSARNALDGFRAACHRAALALIRWLAMTEK
jgi:hypothetical protein